jgi:hypothetical protein
VTGTHLSPLRDYLIAVVALSLIAGAVRAVAMADWSGQDLLSPRTVQLAGDILNFLALALAFLGLLRLLDRAAEALSRRALFLTSVGLLPVVVVLAGLGVPFEDLPPGLLQTLITAGGLLFVASLGGLIHCTFRRSRA